jgi:regulator of protease activity HflC (stomatin/prohibitin superfamily)
MKKHSFVTVLALGLLFLGVGCDRQPFDKPEFKDVKPNETAFLIPTLTESKEQAKFASESFLKENLVAGKRVPIPHQWVKDGRWNSEGHYEPTHTLITVNREPVYREWTKEHTTGTVAKDQAIHVESSDSVGFAVGITAVGLVKEEDAAKFLYYHPSGGDVLALVMDGEVRSRIQTEFQEEANKYTVNDIRDKKGIIMEAVRKDVQDYYKTYGLTIPTIGIVGGFEYENAAIQKTIDETAMMQQLKSQNEAKLAAQSVENQRIAQASEAKRKADILDATTEADKAKLKTQAEIANMQALADAVAKYGPAVRDLRLLDIQKATVEKWDGHLQPTLQGMPMPFQFPTLPSAAPAVAPAAK